MLVRLYIYGERVDAMVDATLYVYIYMCSVNVCFTYTSNQIIIYCLLYYRSARVGKTSLVSRFLGGKFEDSYTPTIEDFHRKLYRIRGEVHQLDILDTSGNHPFPAMRRLSFLTGKVLLCLELKLHCFVSL